MILNMVGLTKRKQKLAIEFFDEDLAQYYTELQTKFPSTTLEKVQMLFSLISLMTDKPSFKFTYTNPEQVLAALRRVLAKSSGSSVYGQSIANFKNELHLLADYLTLLFSRYFNEDRYPDDWKISRVVPLCKESEPQRVSDTKPIINICHFTICGS